VLVIAPFFVMPTVSALIWKNMFMNPVSGLFAQGFMMFGLQPFDFFGQAPLGSIMGIVAWQWLPFATLILLTSLQSLDSEQHEAAEIQVTTNGGPGIASTNLTYLVYVQSLLQYDVGGGSAGGVVAIVLANIVAIFLMWMIGKNLDA
jgi:sorbitol/mannitol transport system permease protein